MYTIGFLWLIRSTQGDVSQEIWEYFRIEKHIIDTTKSKLFDPNQGNNFRTISVPWKFLSDNLLSDQIYSHTHLIFICIFHFASITHTNNIKIIIRNLLIYACLNYQHKNIIYFIKVKRDESAKNLVCILFWRVSTFVFTEVRL